MKNGGSLQNTWWGRTLIILYVLTWVSSTSLVSVIAYSGRTQKIASDSKININCVNNNNSFWEYASTDLVNGILNSDQESQFKKTCQYGLNINDLTKYPEVVSKNFTISPYYDITGDTSAAWVTFYWGLIISFLIIEAIKSIILYILGYTLCRGVTKLMWSWKWYLVGAVVGTAIWPILGPTRYLIAWGAYMLLLAAFELIRGYIKKRKHKQLSS